MFLNQLQVRDGDIVEDAGNFLPERYLGKAKEGSGGLKNFLQYSEFGSSTRSCLGQRTAKIMLKSVIAELFTRYRVEAIPKSQTLATPRSPKPPVPQIPNPKPTPTQPHGHPSGRRLGPMRPWGPAPARHPTPLLYLWLISPPPPQMWYDMEPRISRALQQQESDITALKEQLAKVHAQIECAPES